MAILRVSLQCVHASGSAHEADANEQIYIYIYTVYIIVWFMKEPDSLVVQDLAYAFSGLTGRVENVVFLQALKGHQDG